MDIKFSCSCMIPVNHGIYRYRKSYYCEYIDLFGAKAYIKIGKVKK